MTAPYSYWFLFLCSPARTPRSSGDGTISAVVTLEAAQLAPAVHHPDHGAVVIDAAIVAVTTAATQLPPLRIFFASIREWSTRSRRLMWRLTPLRTGAEKSEKCNGVLRK